MLQEELDLVLRGIEAGMRPSMRQMRQLAEAYRALSTQPKAAPAQDCGIEWMPIPYEQPFEIAKTPVTQAQWRAVMGTSSSHFKGDDLPVEAVSWHEAVKFCQKIGARLPTEEEWQFAALGGGTDPYGPILDIAWVAENSNEQTQPVGRKLPNGYGLYDMLGNVWEWTDTQIGFIRVICGGSWYSDARNARAAIRSNNDPGFRLDDLGFRPARSVKP